ncbi:sialidase family protein [Jiangella asiatica]|uniref:exo-alpha-sialidase n=1 Tax=Jiangella asiatica TaxID=2530372 RepID=A0A4R5D5B2_9ACTN|nr:sialidase family protein [Jiangella asiatica]TDE08632.1 exo-alpha-sialidase [Jiangella asiatica]
MAQAHVTGTDPSGTDPSGTDLWAAGTGGYHTYRIPALVVTALGTVLAFSEGRRHGGGDAGQIDLLVRRSHDHGQSWDEPRLVTSADGFTRGNPAPVVDRASGDVVLLFTQNGAEHTETDICAGVGERTVWVTRSSDDGATWSEPVEITAQVKDPSWTWYATGPCHAVQLTSGRIVVPCDHAVGVQHDRWNDPFRSHVILSDDGGATWWVGGVLPDGTNESTVTELADGRVYFNVRNHARTNLRGHAYSEDRGRTFDGFAWHPELVEPACQGSVLTGPDGALFLANPASATRTRLTVRTSLDDGGTWSDGIVVTEGPAAYSDLALTRDGHLLCLYERGDERPYDSLRLARIPVGKVVAGG